jgi:hypothetical protein
MRGARLPSRTLFGVSCCRYVVTRNDGSEREAKSPVPRARHQRELVREKMLREERGSTAAEKRRAHTTTGTVMRT